MRDVGAERERTETETGIVAGAAERERDPDHPIEDLFYRRWSPRAMTGERVSGSTLDSLFEAARWAPSSRNRQHWHFRYATRGDDHFETFLDFLYEGNREWAADAGALMVLTTKDRFDGDEDGSHSFSAGTAFQNLALEGARRDLAVHPIGGFDDAAAREGLAVPDDHAVDVMVAVGPAAPPESLPEDLADRETPSPRDPVEEFVGRGPFDE